MVKGRRVVSTRSDETDVLSIKFSCENNREEAKNRVMDLLAASTMVIYFEETTLWNHLEQDAKCNEYKYATLGIADCEIDDFGPFQEVWVLSLARVAIKNWPNCPILGSTRKRGQTTMKMSVIELWENYIGNINANTIYVRKGCIKGVRCNSGSNFSNFSWHTYPSQLPLHETLNWKRTVKICLLLLV